MNFSIQPLSTRLLRLALSIPFLSLLLPTAAHAHDMSELAQERMASGGYLEVIWTGAEHMMSGYDHLLFLLGVMFFLTRFIDILKFITAFTVGHTITLIIATYASISANHYLIDAVIAVTVAYKGFENINGFQRWLGIRPPNLLFMVFLFGLIHGFGLSAQLQDVTLADDPNLLGKILLFNVGVEVGQVVALLVMAVAIRAWQKLPLWPKLSYRINLGLIAAGFVLLVVQLTGYFQERQIERSGDSVIEFEIFTDVQTMIGQVRYANGEPLAETTLSIEPIGEGQSASVQTDAGGWFAFTGQADREYRVHVEDLRGVQGESRVSLGRAADDHSHEYHIPLYWIIAVLVLLSAIPARMARPRTAASEA